jgi:hypothetical protein
MTKPQEVTEVHTRILRMALGIEDTRAYWENVDADVPIGHRSTFAFEKRWFGTKSQERVRTLLAYFQARFDVFPEALLVLHNWKNMTPSTRQLICHWHLQLTDPLYRKFTGEFLVQRRAGIKPPFDKSVVVRWINKDFPDRWSASTVMMFASKLLTAASEAGLVTSKKDPRTPLIPNVPDEALGYLLYLLCGITFEGSLMDNPYTASVGLMGDFIEQRLRTLPGFRFQRMGDLVDFGRQFESLSKWAKETL